MLQMINLMKQPTPDGAPIGQVVLIVMAIILVVSYWVHTVVAEKKEPPAETDGNNKKFEIWITYIIPRVGR